MAKIIKIIFGITLFLIPLGEVFRFDFGNGISIRPLDIGVVLLVGFWLILKLIKKERILQGRIYIPFLLFAGSGALSLLINSPHLASDQLLGSFMYLIRWIAYSGIFFVSLGFDTKFKEIVSKIIVIIGSVVVSLGYLQYFFYPNLRKLYYLGWDEHMYRMFSVFLDPNFAGSFFVLFLLFLINAFLKKKNFVLGIMMAFTLGAVFLTFSRSVLIMLIVSVSLLLTLMNKKRFILLLLAITFTVILISSRYFNIENINLFRIVSSEARIETAKNALIIIQDHPIFGVGFNAYRYAQYEYGFRSDVNISSHADSSPDNSLLFVLATTGIIGLVTYLSMWFRLVQISSPLAIASIAGVFVNSMFINSLFYPFIMFWLWVIIAFGENPNRPHSLSSK